MMTAFYLLVGCSALMIAASYISPELLKEESKALVWNSWREPLRGEAGGRWRGDYRVLSGVVIALFIVLYWLFR